MYICEFHYIHLLFSLRTRNYSRNTGFEEKRRWSAGACAVYSLMLLLLANLSFHPAVFDDSVYALLRSSSLRDFNFNSLFSVLRTMMTFSVHVYIILCVCVMTIMMVDHLSLLSHARRWCYLNNEYSCKEYTFFLLDTRLNARQTQQHHFFFCRIYVKRKYKNNYTILPIDAYTIYTLCAQHSLRSLHCTI